MPLLAVARLWYEANSFSPAIAGLDAFRRREWAMGEHALARHSGTSTELGAVADLAARGIWRVVTLRCAAAGPGGPMAEGLFAQALEETVAGLAGRDWDAVYLSLHGALVTTERPRADLDFVRAVRAAVGDTPLGASFDLHANLAPEIVHHLDFASGYRTYPHVDMRETAHRVLGKLARRVRGGAKLKGALAKAGAILPSHNMRTDAGPMAEVMERASDVERERNLVDASVFGGFAYADTPDAGASALAWAEDETAAQAGAADIARALYERRGRFRPQLLPPAAALDLALRAPPGLVAVTESADNPMSGGLGDTTGLFRALLALKPPVPSVFAFFADPEVVDAARRVGVGGMLRARLGGRIAPAFGPPVEVDAKVLRLTDGKFANLGAMDRGVAIDLGGSAVLDVAGLQVIVAKTCYAADDPAFYRLHGIDLARTRLLAVKAKNHFRAAMGPLCRTIVDCDTPGPAAADLSTLPYRRIPESLRAGLNRP